MTANISANFASLDQAYQQTLYEVFAKDATIQLRVNSRNTALDRLLLQHKVVAGALITAHNPYSQPLSLQDNHQRNQTLVNTLQAMGLPTLPAVGRDESGHWPPEKSLFVLGISRTNAIDLGRQFEQNAILYGELAQPVELLWLVNKAQP